MEQIAINQQRNFLILSIFLDLDFFPGCDDDDVRLALGLRLVFLRPTNLVSLDERICGLTKKAVSAFITVTL